ncbi:hypothetical protein E4K39_09370 [Neisseria meningitidis]|nr:hypothetical protein [Neisseria meningitidis]MBG8587967.1 hypothetical protein [Neisseria meningitidis]MBG8591704.1 hypothetical protein [Neisseria meningitidis]MBG8601165.1 hypothetical protein [Neisseria meningitidis]MBG8607783.1 hypothetical protein [Neisseria meningitidis]
MRPVISASLEWIGVVFTVGLLSERGVLGICLCVSDFLYWVWGIWRFRRPFKPYKGSSENLTIVD